MSNRGELDSINDLRKDLLKSVEQAESLLKDVEAKEYSEKWSTKYINDLPNAAFAVIEKGYSEGKDKRGRHLPHHGKNVKSATENSSVDLVHFRNALARANQVKSALGNESDSSLRKKAASHLEKHRAVLKTSKSSFNHIELSIWEECEKLFADNVEPLLSDNKPEEGNNG
jgi:hypothetical protein